MTRVASLYLPQLAIERLRRLERPARPLEHVPAAPRFARPVDDDPGACSVPRGGAWRPGARWARDGALGHKPHQSDIDALPAHQRPSMREMGRRSEAAEHPFKAMARGEGSGGSAPAISWGRLWGRPTVLIARSGQRDIVTSACPVALDLGLRPGMAAAHARALVTELEVRDAEPDADRAWLDRLALHAVGHWTPTASVCDPDGLWLDLTGTTHLFGGEQRFCHRLLRFLQRRGFTASIAVAGTAGAAYLPPGVPLLKHVRALPGQTICRSGATVWVEGKAVARALETDRFGRPLPVWTGCHRMRPGQIFLLNAEAPDSLDSRYFGPVPSGGLIGTATPLLTWPSRIGAGAWSRATP